MAEISDDERTDFKGLGLLTSKPVVYVCNVDEASATTGKQTPLALERGSTVDRRGHRAGMRITPDKKLWRTVSINVSLR